MLIREYYDEFPPQSTLKELVFSGAERGGDKRQFIWEDEDENQHERSFREVHEEENKLGTFLQLHGIGKNSKVSILKTKSGIFSVTISSSAKSHFACSHFCNNLS